MPTNKRTASTYSLITLLKRNVYFEWHYKIRLSEARNFCYIVWCSILSAFLIVSFLDIFQCDFVRKKVNFHSMYICISIEIEWFIFLKRIIKKKLKLLTIHNVWQCSERWIFWIVKNSHTHRETIDRKIAFLFYSSLLKCKWEPTNPRRNEVKFITCTHIFMSGLIVIYGVLSVRSTTRFLFTKISKMYPAPSNIVVITVTIIIKTSEELTTTENSNVSKQRVPTYNQEEWDKCYRILTK